jgi:hypothetical protein
MRSGVQKTCASNATANAPDKLPQRPNRISAGRNDYRECHRVARTFVSFFTSFAGLMVTIRQTAITDAAIVSWVCPPSAVMLRRTGGTEFRFLFRMCGEQSCSTIGRCKSAGIQSDALRRSPKPLVCRCPQGTRSVLECGTKFRFSSGMRGREQNSCATFPDRTKIQSGALRRTPKPSGCRANSPYASACGCARCFLYSSTILFSWSRGISS